MTIVSRPFVEHFAICSRVVSGLAHFGGRLDHGGESTYFFYLVSFVFVKPMLTAFFL